MIAKEVILSTQTGFGSGRIVSIKGLREKVLPFIEQLEHFPEEIERRLSSIYQGLTAYSQRTGKTAEELEQLVADVKSTFGEHFLYKKGASDMELREAMISDYGVRQMMKDLRGYPAEFYDKDKEKTTVNIRTAQEVHAFVIEHSKTLEQITQDTPDFAEALAEFARPDTIDYLQSKGHSIRSLLYTTQLPTSARISDSLAALVLELKPVLDKAKENNQSSNDAMRTRYQEMDFPGQGKIADIIERLQPFSFRTETQYYDENLNLIPLAIGTGEEAITINSIPVWWNGRYKPITERQVTELVVLDKALSDSYEPHTDQRKNHPDAEAMIRTIISTDLSALGINTEINIENLRRVYGNTVYSYFGKRKLVSEKAYQNIAQLYTSIEQAKSDNKLFQRTQRWSQSKQPYREIARPFYDMLISELKMTLLPRELEDAYRLIKGTSAKWGRDGKRKRQYNFKDRAQTMDESFFNYVVDDFVGGLDRYLSGKELALTIDDTHPTMHNLRQDYDDQRLARQSLPDQQKQRENDQRLQVYQKTLTHVVDVFNRCLERYDKKA